MPYSIVLTPSADQAIRYVEASQALYSHCQPSYLLAADGSSSPHITVIQFDCDTLELAYPVWNKMCDQMEEAKFEPFVPSFVGVSFIEGAGSYEGTTWVELAIDRNRKASPIMEVHHSAIKALQTFDLNPINASGDNYRPHLTLARIILPKQMGMWTKALLENPGYFNLEFGVSDEKWQYARTIEIFPRFDKKKL